MYKYNNNRLYQSAWIEVLRTKYFCFLILFGSQRPQDQVAPQITSDFSLILHFNKNIDFGEYYLFWCQYYQGGIINCSADEQNHQ